MDRIPIFPLRTVLFPHTDTGLHVFEDRYRTLVARCLDSGDGFGVVLIRRGNEVAGPADPHAVGTYARIAAHARLPDGRFLLEVEGTRRFRIESVAPSDPYPQADVAWLPESVGDFGRARSASDAAASLLVAYRARLGLEHLALPVSPVARSYIAAAGLRIDAHELQDLLETPAADQRLARAASLLRREIGLMNHLSELGATQPDDRRHSRFDN